MEYSIQKLRSLTKESGISGEFRPHLTFTVVGGAVAMEMEVELMPEIKKKPPGYFSKITHLRKHQKLLSKFVAPK